MFYPREDRLRDLAEQILASNYSRLRHGGRPVLDDLCRIYPEIESSLRKNYEDLSAAWREQKTDTPRIPRYQIQRRIGDGGMGSVFLATSEARPGELLAVKVLRRSAAHLDREHLKRFRREAGFGTRLQHENILPVYDFAECEEGPFIVMPYVRGCSLATWSSSNGPCAKGIFTESSAETLPRWAPLEYLVEIARALDYVHREQVVHRDIKPANILVSDEGKAFLIDFGVSAHPDSTETLTKSGFVPGTLAYKSPEQISGKRSKVNYRSDLYSLGVTAYSVCTGRLPFVGASEKELRCKILCDTPPRLSQFLNSAPPGLEAFLERALEKSPRRRFSSAREFAEELEDILHRQPIELRPEPPPTLPRIKRELLRQGRRLLFCRRIELVGLCSSIFILVLVLVIVLQRERIQRHKAEILFLNAYADLQGGSIDRATQRTEKGLSLDDENPNGYVLRAALYSRNGYNDRVRQAIKRATALLEDTGDRPDPEALSSLGQGLQLMFGPTRKPSQAEELFREASGTSPYAKMFLAWALFAQNRRGEASQVLSDYHAGLSEADSIHTRMIEAYLHEYRGEYKAAESALKALNKECRGELQIDRHLGRVLLQARDLDKAKHHLSEANRQDPDDVGNLIMLASLHYELFKVGRDPQIENEELLAMEKHLDRARELCPNHPKILPLTAWLARERDPLEFEQLLAELEGTPEDNDAFRSFRNYLAGDRTREAGDLEKAILFYETSLEYAPDNAIVVESFAAVLLSLGIEKKSLDHAKRSYQSYLRARKLIERDAERGIATPDQIFGINAGVLNAASVVGLPDAAIDSVTRLRSIYNESDHGALPIQALLNLAMVLASMEAIQDCKWATEIIDEIDLNQLNLSSAEKNRAIELITFVRGRCSQRQKRNP